METAHHHRYTFHFNVIISVLALILILFGLYISASSQTAGDPYAPSNYGNVNYSNFGQPANNSSSGGWWSTRNADRNSSGAGNYGGAGYNTGGQQQGSNYGQTGGSFYNSGGTYYTNSVVDNNPYPTQGGYVVGTGQSVYNNPGLVEAGAVPTSGAYVNTTGQSVFNVSGVNETIAAPTQQNTLSYKNCQFITKYHRFGDRGGDVPKIQQFLKDRGYYKGRIDGVYGISTFRAVQAFQRDYKSQILDPWEFDNKSAVEGTGITNVSTKYAINKLVGCPDPATIVPKTGRLLNY